MSGGLKRRLAIAIACCGKSKIIVLDEPTGGVDIVSMNKIWEILLKLKAKQKIIILITHFMEEASYLADQIGVLKDGKIICRGSSKYLIDHYGKYITIQINKRRDEKSKDLVYFIKDNFLLKENQIDSKSYSSDSNSSYSNGKNLIDGTSISSRINDTIIKVSQKFEIKVFKERIVVKIPTRLFNFSNIFR